MGEAFLSPPRHGFRPMKFVILDGYVDEPSNFGVPPYFSPYPRYVAGAVRDAGHEWEYVTVDQVRAGHPLNGDLLVLLSGPIVPGKYLRSLPISEREIIHHASAFEGLRVFGGPLARFRYYDESLVEPPTPDITLRAIRELLSGIRAAAPNLKVLHTDNGDPAMMIAHPDEAMAAIRDLVRFATPGTILSFGLESADPRVTEANNLNIDADGCLEAIRMVNEVGRERGGNGIPWLLPGLNFVAGLDGETRRTFDLNLAFLKQLLDEDLWIPRIK